MSISFSQAVFRIYTKGTQHDKCELPMHTCLCSALTNDSFDRNIQEGRSYSGLPSAKLHDLVDFEGHIPKQLRLIQFRSVQMSFRFKITATILQYMTYRGRAIFWEVNFCAGPRLLGSYLSKIQNFEVILRKFDTLKSLFGKILILGINFGEFLLNLLPYNI